jgi:D-alanyl-D-alanine carboxypeptidase/D-alanyl-D-alanine-endopeptidase (penicillin-binding protein 4)
MDQIVLADGSGLSDRNRVTAAFMTRYLRAVAKKPWFPVFRDSLAKPGHDGTVKELKFSDSRFRVKTGMLKDVLALAGYGVDAAGREIAFTYIVNGPGAGLLPLDGVGSEALRYLANEVHL